MQSHTYFVLKIMWCNLYKTLSRLRIGLHIIAVFEPCYHKKALVFIWFGFEPDMKWQFKKYRFYFPFENLRIRYRSIFKPTLCKRKPRKKPEIKIFTQFQIGNHVHVYTNFAFTFCDQNAVIIYKKTRLVQLIS